MEFAISLPWWILALLAAAIAAAAWFPYARTVVSISRGRRGALVGLRAFTLLLLIACLMPATPAEAAFAVKDRDYQVIVAQGQGSDAIYVVDNRTGVMAVFTYDNRGRVLRPRQVRPVVGRVVGGGYVIVACGTLSRNGAWQATDGAVAQDGVDDIVYLRHGVCNVPRAVLAGLRLRPRLVVLIVDTSPKR